MNEKKRTILLAAMKLFSKTSFHQTSMQQIAEVCGISKGSLYTHFKSKEELLADIFTYYYQMLHDQIAAATEGANNPKDDFIQEVAIRTRHYCAFQEFFMMQLKEIRGLEDPSLNTFVRQENQYLMQRTEKGIIAIYGEQIAPYAADLTASLKGFMISYLREITEKEARQDFDQLARYLFSQMDAAANWMLASRPAPFFQSYLSEENAQQQDRAVHPLHLIKKVKEAAAEEQASDMMLDSIVILEKELLEVKPRQAVLHGMMANLSTQPALQPLVEELKQAVMKMPETLHL